MNYLILMRGAAGVGKSTWIKENGLEPYTLSADTIRLQIQSPVLTIKGEYSISQYNDNRVWKILMEMLEARMQRGEFCVIDATNSKPSDYAKYKRLAEDYRYRIYAVDFGDVPLETILAQNKQRFSYKVVPEDAIRNMHARIQNFDAPKYVTMVKPNQFWDTIARHPNNYDRYAKIVLFGDTHSCFSPLEAYFKAHPERDDYLYIHLGDIFDRGPQTREMGEWLITHYNRTNWIFLQSNHNLHLTNWAFEKECRSNEFKYNTMPVLLELGDMGLWRNVARKFHQIVYFTYGENTYFCNHAGLPKLPSAMEFPLISCQEFNKGPGRYEDIDRIAEIWNEKTPPHYYQFHGHRSFHEEEHMTFNVGRSYNLNGDIEHHGGLKVAELDRDGIITCRYYPNGNIRPNVARELGAPPASMDFSSNESFVAMLRSHKGIRENRMGNISSFNFKNSVFKGAQWDEWTETARGMFVNNVTNEVVARGWNKSFNFGERPETKLESLCDNLIFPCVAYHKYNGFLGILGWDSHMKQSLFCTKSSIDNDYSKNFERIFRDSHNSELVILEDLMRDTNVCCLFEVIDPINDPHIIEYSDAHVVMLDVLDRIIKFNDKGSYETLLTLKAFNNMIIKEASFVLNNLSELKDLIEKTRDYNGFQHEGFMVRDATGFTFKLKTEFYLKWKKMRGMLYNVKAGHGINYSKLHDPLEQEFVAFLKAQDRNQLPSSIIEARNNFYK